MLAHLLSRSRFKREWKRQFWHPWAQILNYILRETKWSFQTTLIVRWSRADGSRFSKDWNNEKTVWPKPIHLRKAGHFKQLRSWSLHYWQGAARHRPWYYQVNSRKLSKFVRFPVLWSRRRRYGLWLWDAPLGETVNWLPQVDQDRLYNLPVSWGLNCSCRAIQLGIRDITYAWTLWRFHNARQWRRLRCVQKLIDYRKAVILRYEQGSRSGHFISDDPDALKRWH